jgi:hypothetical protein
MVAMGLVRILGVLKSCTMKVSNHEEAEEEGFEGYGRKVNDLGSVWGPEPARERRPGFSIGGKKVEIGER